jgi:hypothetical protein
MSLSRAPIATGPFLSRIRAEKPAKCPLSTKVGNGTMGPSGRLRAIATPSAFTSAPGSLHDSCLSMRLLGASPRKAFSWNLQRALS